MWLCVGVPYAWICVHGLCVMCVCGLYCVSIGDACICLYMCRCLYRV